jgi:hypothetical protein
MRRLIRWMLHEAWEKINVAATFREILAQGKKYGRRFVVVAILWECVEDLVFPFLSWKFGVPELIPMFLILHFEPVVYPLFFWLFRTWDRAHGREPWEPDRDAQSSYWRSVMKVAVYQLDALGWLSSIVPWRPLSVFAVLISLFSVVHERIWHDTNYGINPEPFPRDFILPKRMIVKTFTFLGVSAMTLYPFLKVFAVPMHQLPLALLATGVVYFALEIVWSKSVLGITKIERNEPISMMAMATPETVT